MKKHCAGISTAKLLKPESYIKFNYKGFLGVQSEGKWFKRKYNYIGPKGIIIRNVYQLYLFGPKQLHFKILFFKPIGKRRYKLVFILEFGDVKL